MKIKSFIIVGLFGRKDTIHMDFNDDINIITGRNGSGKTTVLKLLWFILSGNISLALKEIIFKKVTLVTTEYEFIIGRTALRTCRIEWTPTGGDLHTFTSSINEHGDIIGKDKQREFSSVFESGLSVFESGLSVFFPTFRRIEGGFSIPSVPYSDTRISFRSFGASGISNALIEISERLTNKNHVFVTSLSTADIVSLLMSQHTDLSEKRNRLQEQVSKSIIEKIKAFSSNELDAQKEPAMVLIDEIRIQIENLEKSSEGVMKPLEVMRTLVMRFLRYPGIQLGKDITFGDAVGAIHSDALSAGEKQMLSFIAYNACYKDAIIIIDEPELSLHVDWQRLLFPTLLSQHASNQFVVATHSPFIYSKYPDKELQIDSERGDEGE